MTAMNKKEWLEKGAIIEYLTAVKDVCVSNEEFETSNNLGKIILEIKNGEIPSADVAPVKHGEWIFGEFDGIGNSVKCSACGFCQKSVDPKLWIEYPAHKFCGVWYDNECVVQFHPPKQDYINNHPYCLHLWRKCGNEFELPPKEFV